jgi:hypothetical protein
MELVVGPDTLAVCRLPADAPWPGPPEGAPFYSATLAPDGISVVCPATSAPRDAEVEDGWSLLSVVGPLEFTMVGVLSTLSSALAGAGLSIFVVSTFETDHILVGADSLESAVSALEGAGHTVHRR